MARIYKLEKKDHLEELKVLEHPESRLRNIDLVGDRPGRDLEVGVQGRHALEQKRRLKNMNLWYLPSCWPTIWKRRAMKGFTILLYIAGPTLPGTAKGSFAPKYSQINKRGSGQRHDAFQAA